MRELTTADLERSRLHLFWIKLGFAAVVVSLIVSDIVALELSDTPWRIRFPFWSLPYVASGALMASVGLVFVVWFVPRLALLWAVPTLWLYSYSHSAHPMLWRAGAALAGMVLLWLLWRARRAIPRGKKQVPGGSRPFKESYAYRDERDGWLMAGLGIFAALIVLVIHHFLVAGTVSFEARAMQETGVVLSYDEQEEESHMVVRIGEREVRVEDPFGSDLAVGAMVDVLVDPEDEDYVVLANDLEDHSWLLGVAALVPVMGLGFGLPHAASARWRRRLVEQGGPARRVRVQRGPDGLRVLPTDATWPFLELTDLQGIVPREEVDDFAYGGEDEDDDELDEDDEALPADDAELAAWADGMRSDWLAEPSEIDYSELTEPEKLLAQATDGPDIEGSEHFVLLGPYGQGSSVALVQESGQVWLGEVAEPHFRAGATPTFWRGTDAGPGGPGGQGDATRGLKGEIRAWGIKNYAWLRWVAFVVLSGPFAWIIPWAVRDMLDDWDLFSWGILFLMVVMAFQLPLLLLSDGLYENGRSRHGMITYGILTDEVVSPERLVSVAAGETAVGVKLRDPDDVRAVYPEHVGRGLTSEKAALQVRSWFSEASPGSRSGRLPGPGVIVPVVLVIAWGVQLLDVLG
ncbi:MAG: hypothetical protein Q4P15_12145 [Propionibacteriaceae bacterium]|nr:hypothetical protein [Propionibacteriaceae bacterium]